MPKLGVPDVQSYIACLLVTSVIVMIFVLIFHPIHDADDVTKTAIGAMLTVGFSTIISFYFGSSSGSKSKDDTLNQIAQGASAPVASVPPVSPAPPAA